MIAQLATGAGILMLNILVAAVAAFWLEMAFRSLHPWMLRPPQRPKLLLLLVIVGLWVLVVITLAVLIWALAFLALGAFADLETALYFSLVAFTTLGFGDLLLPQEWRLLAGMEAANGFISFGLLTALMAEALRQVRLSQIRTRHSVDE